MITLQDLNDYLDMNKLIEIYNEKLDDLEYKISHPSQRPLDATPRSRNSKDALGDSIAELVDRKNKVHKMIIEIENKRKIIEDFFNQVKPIRLRVLLIERYCNGKTWREASFDAEYGSEESAKKEAYRYLKRLNDKEKNDEQ